MYVCMYVYICICEHRNTKGGKKNAYESNQGEAQKKKKKKQSHTASFFFFFFLQIGSVETGKERGGIRCMQYGMRHAVSCFAEKKKTKETVTETEQGMQNTCGNSGSGMLLAV